MPAFSAESAWLNPYFLLIFMKTITVRVIYKMSKRIEQLFELNQKGILTDEEFKVKKEELLKKYEYII